MLNAVKDFSKEFCSNTSLHGYKFIVQKDKPICFRLTWIFIITVAFTIAYYLIWCSWKTNEDNIVLVADSVHYPIWNYQFPAITICNINRASLKQTNAFISKLSNLNNFNREYIIILLQHLIKLIVEIQYSKNNLKFYNDMEILMDLNNLTTLDVLKQIRPSCKDTLTSCSWKARLWTCDSLFEEISTLSGMCCTSNYYAIKNHSFAGRLSERYKTTARRISSVGDKMGYKVLIRNNPEDYLIASSPAIGTKVFIHDSYDYPGWTAPMAAVGMSEEAFIAISPTIQYATKAVLDLKVSIRKCFFYWENKLHFFNDYSQINCLMECRANLIKNKCGCIPLFFWDLYKNASGFEMCNISSASCVHSFASTLATFLPGFKYDGRKEFNFDEAEHKNLCNCLPGCEINYYDIETSKTILSRVHASNYNQFFSGKTTVNHSGINVYFKDLIASRHKKDVTSSWYSSLAWIGGILGLFVGFSITSGYEILYYLSIRFLLDYYMGKKTNRIQSNKQKNNKIRPIYKIEHNIFDNPEVPSLKQLRKLKKRNNSWFVE